VRFCAGLTWCGVVRGRDKRLTTGKPVFDLQPVLLHHQREMQLQRRETKLMREQMENVTRLLLHQTELIQRLAVPVSAKVRFPIGNQGLEMSNGGFRIGGKGSVSGTDCTMVTSNR